MARQNGNEITKYRKPLNINIGMIIFGVMFIYIIICIVLYFRTTHLTGYEVKTGSLSENNVYHGIALRSEEIVKSTAAGYVYYFQPQGTHVGVSDLVYTVDSAGTLADSLNMDTSSTTLSDDQLASLRTKIINYQGTFSTADFSTVYDFKQEIGNEVTNISNDSILESMNKVNSATQGITRYTAQKPGNLVYYTDGFESVKPADITDSSFDQSKYKQTQFSSDKLVGNGDAVFAMVTSEDWTVMIEADNTRAKQLEKDGYVKVKFLKDQFESYGKVTLYGQSKDGKSTFVGLSFSNSMLDYISDRFLDIELILEEKSGLKIPNSAIAQMNFFLVPKEYFVKDGTTGEDGVMRVSYTDKNEKTTEFVAASIYNEENGQYYVDEDVLAAGDILTKPDSTDTYTVSKQASLVGVFNINKGYADFRQITILYQNDEYAIVESNTQYGLSDYDYIALDASSVKDNQFVYDQK